MVPIEVLWIAIPGASAVLYTLLFFVRRHDLGSLENWFAYFLAAGVVWSVGSALLHANPGFISPIWFVRLEALGTITMPWALFWFTTNFLSLPMRRQKLWLIGSTLAYALVLIVNLTSAVVSDTQVVRGLVSNQYEWGVGLVALFWFGHFLPAAFLLIREERRTQDRMFRNRVRYLLLVMALLLVGNVTNATSLGVYPVDLFMASIAALLISLSVSRYQVLEMGHVLRRLVALILVISVYVIVVSATLYVLASLTSEWLLPAE
ncbi:MAG: hypothetical protein M1140_14690, partial [Chloroflexi bacterium]|nr:hypothetical protein [Chloroflexota bacterium]